MTWVCRLHTIPSERLDDLLEYCRKADEMDDTFTFKKEGEYVLITCPTKDVAHRRGTLFHFRFGCFYEVEWEKSKS